MVTQEEKTVEVVNQAQETRVKKKQSGWMTFLHFLMYGGWILMVIVILGIVIAVSILTAPK